MVEDPQLHLIPAFELAADSGIQSERERFAEYVEQILDDYLAPASMAEKDRSAWAQRVAEQIAAGDPVDTTDKCQAE